MTDAVRQDICSFDNLLPDWLFKKMMRRERTMPIARPVKYVLFRESVILSYFFDCSCVSMSFSFLVVASFSALYEVTIEVIIKISAMPQARVQGWVGIFAVWREIVSSLYGWARFDRNRTRPYGSIV